MHTIERAFSFRQPIVKNPKKISFLAPFKKTWLYMLASYVVKGLKGVGNFLEECHRRAVEEIMKANPGMTWEEAERILAERFRDYSY